MAALATVACTLLSTLLLGAGAGLGIVALAGITAVGLFAIVVMAIYGLLRAVLDGRPGDDG